MNPKKYYIASAISIEPVLPGMVIWTEFRSFNAAKQHLISKKKAAIVHLDMEIATLYKEIEIVYALEEPK